ncbi:hypothetical protein, partial [Vibrio vulnificus]|uniref:hypothetical protein n=1 Tax=Vibrio vulnificus TaxID=672 RepID=UPI0019D4CD8D
LLKGVPFLYDLFFAKKPRPMMLHRRLFCLYKTLRDKVSMILETRGRYAKTAPRFFMDVIQ